jgi:hypothetical protein
MLITYIVPFSAKIDEVSSRTSLEVVAKISIILKRYTRNNERGWKLLE